MAYAGAGVPVSAAGGYVVFNQLDQSATYDGIVSSNWGVLDNTDYQISAPGITDDVTTSAVGTNTVAAGNNSAANGTRVALGRLRLSVAISFPDDDPATLEANSNIVVGSRYNLYCRRGASSATGKWDIVDHCTFTGFTTDNPTAAGTPRKRVANFEGGGYTGGQSAPTALSTYLSSISRS